MLEKIGFSGICLPSCVSSACTRPRQKTEPKQQQQQKPPGARLHPELLLLSIILLPFISWDPIRKNTASSSGIFMSVCEQKSNMKGHHSVKII